MANQDPSLQTAAQAPVPAAASVEVASNAFVNARGETVNPTLVLTVDPERGETWRNWAAASMPVELFQVCGLVGVEGSEDWANLVEHSMFVAAASLTIAHSLQVLGVSVDEKALARAAWAHDATKRSDVMKGISREDEAKEDILPRLLGEFGYSGAEIAAARNTGRLDDRYLTDPVERLRAIANRSVEENIVGYADARTRGARIASVEEARADSIAAKPKDAAFFNDNWAPYYSAVEGYFQAIAPGFEPAAINGDAIYATVEQTL